MNTDKKYLYELVNTIDNISKKINSELLNLKKKINYTILESPLKNYHYKFLQDILVPLSSQKPNFSMMDIKLMFEKTKPLEESTIRSYLSVLNRNGYIRIKKKQDKRSHLYELV